MPVIGAALIAALVMTVPPQPIDEIYDLFRDQFVGQRLLDVQCAEDFPLYVCRGRLPDGSYRQGVTQDSGASWEIDVVTGPLFPPDLGSAAEECRQQTDLRRQYQVLDAGHSVLTTNARAFACVARLLGFPEWFVRFVAQADSFSPTSMRFGSYTVTWSASISPGGPSRVFRAAIYDDGVDPDN